jgi:CHAT domain-containing protein
LWVLCQQRSAPGSGRAAVFGVSDVLIPAAEAEAQAVAQQLPNASLRINQTATLAEFQSCAPGCAIVHLACHGFFRADNPLFSSLKLQDGWLMAADVPTLDLRGALVTLSACESGRSQVLAGDELMGLSRAFLGAGAATLVTSLWLVNDQTTSTLMQGFYAHLMNPIARAGALRQAQLALKASHPHPYFWAPFVLVGQR